MKKARNFSAFAIGCLDRGKQFHVRRVVWGRLMARAEKRSGEQIRKCEIHVAEKAS
jgi:hypothetical protein